MFSNRYIIIYSIVMVLIVAAALTVVAVQLKPAQVNNQRVEKMQNILAAANIESTVKNASDLYKKYITKTLVTDLNGKVSEEDAFEIDLEKENQKALEARKLPVFICTKDDGSKYWIVPLRGKGLWGPIWGYISFKQGLQSVEGVIFDHKGETPGLGAEIAEKKFQSQFARKSIFDTAGKFVSIRVVKGGAPKGDPNAVDAISGGTITSRGLEAMLKNDLGYYLKYFETLKDSTTQQTSVQ